jgi:ribosomal-protein-alanine N-acetyltransferase
MNIIETERLLIREIVEDDAPFINALLNSSGFLKYIGDRGVRSDDDARTFIHERLRKSYEVNGYGLYAVLLKAESKPVGICGFVRRDTLPGPDLGFAFLPEFEGKGFGMESSTRMLEYGREELKFDDLYAITTLDNTGSIKLLEKLGFAFDKTIDMPNGETLKLFSMNLN